MPTGVLRPRLGLVIQIGLLMLLPLAAPMFQTDALDFESVAPVEGRVSHSTHLEMWSASSGKTPTIPMLDCVLAGIVTKADGTSYVVGSYKGEISFGNTTLSQPDGWAMFVAELDEDGVWGWAISSSGDNMKAKDVTLNHDDSLIYVVGTYRMSNYLGGQGIPYGPSSTDAMFIADITLSGSVIGVGVTQGTDSNALGVVASPGGGALVTGGHASRMIFRDTAGSTVATLTSTGVDAWVGAWNAGGWLWATGTTCVGQVCGNETGKSLTVDGSGNLYVIGDMDSAASFGESGSGPDLTNGGASAVTTDIFVWKIAVSNGATIAVTGTSGVFHENAVDIVSDANSLYIAGNFAAWMNLGADNISTFHPLIFTGFVASLSLDLQTWNWARAINSSSDSGPTSGRFTLIEMNAFFPWKVTDLSVAAEGGVHVAGEYGLNNTTLDSFVLPDVSTSLVYDVFLAHLSSDGDWTNVMTANGEGSDGMTRVSDSTSGKTRLAFDSNAPSSITMGGSTHTPNNRSVIVAAIAWDIDGDGIPDADDNCPALANSKQDDHAQDGIGDACTIDTDGDGVENEADNCAAGDIGWQSGATTDHDADGCRDAGTEDSDDDNDGVVDVSDDCAKGETGWFSNTLTDVDGDGCRDASEDSSIDIDGDGLIVSLDSCPAGETDWISGATTDYDGDGCQDATDEDSDDDNDLVLDSLDFCAKGELGWISNNSTDYDGDGCRDDSEEDYDDDSDTVYDTVDSCAKGELGWISNNSTDHDGDGCKDLSPEDIDDDGDGVNDTSDTCPKGDVGWISNATSDPDSDGCPGRATDDMDGDGLNDSSDGCPNGETGWTSNSSTDYDGDGCKDDGEDTDDDADGITDKFDSCPTSELGWKSTPITDSEPDGCVDVENEEGPQLAGEPASNETNFTEWIVEHVEEVVAGGTIVAGGGAFIGHRSRSRRRRREGLDFDDIDIDRRDRQQKKSEDTSSDHYFESGMKRYESLADAAEDEL